LRQAVNKPTAVRLFILKTSRARCPLLAQSGHREVSASAHCM
jgi:hypothetical protein